MLGCGAHLRYHGDFDVAGLAICARMFRLGLQPWRMSVTDYLEAIDTARKDGIVLPVDEAPPGPTPWDPDLRAVFRQHRLIVHEERLLDELLG